MDSIISDGRLTVRVYGIIGQNVLADSPSTNCLYVIEDIENYAANGGGDIKVRFNSLGGSLADGLAMYNAFKSYKGGKVIGIIDSVAASAASVALAGCDEIYSYPLSKVMVHQPKKGTFGSAQDHIDAAKTLSSWAETCVLALSEKSGKPIDFWQPMVEGNGDTWIIAEQAKEYGLVDEIIDLTKETTGRLDNAEVHNTLADKELMAKLMDSAQTAEINAQEVWAMLFTTTTSEEEQTMDPKEILMQDLQRRNAIADMLKPFGGIEGVSEIQAKADGDFNFTVEDARKEAMEILAKASHTPVARPTASVVADATDKFREGAIAALEERVGISARADAGNEFRGHSMLELARKSLEIANVSTSGMTQMDIVGNAFSNGSSQLSNILSNVAHKSVMKGFNDAQETYSQWTSEGVLTDFKPASRVDLNGLSGLRKVNEYGEYKYVEVGDRGETIILMTYGELLPFTRVALINNDLSIIERLPRMAGDAVKTQIGNLVYAVLTNNAAMSDGTALFHADHSNLLTGGSAAAINTASVSAMRSGMAKQTVNGVAKNIRLANLIVPVALEDAANTVRDSMYEVGASTRNNTTPNTQRGRFNVISDARLDLDSAIAWYGTADANTTDVVEVAYLDGVKTPYLEQFDQMTRDGVTYKIRIDVGVSPLSHLTLSKNTGA